MRVDEILSTTKPVDWITEDPTVIPVPDLSEPQATPDLSLKYPNLGTNILKEGVKYDEGKARYDLLPPDSLEELVKVFTIGAKKYEDRNWEKGMAWGRVFAAMMRHAWAWWRGETLDPENGQHHLASVAWCAIVLLAYDMRKIGTDTRKILP